MNPLIQPATFFLNLAKHVGAPYVLSTKATVTAVRMETIPRLETLETLMDMGDTKAVSSDATIRSKFFLDIPRGELDGRFGFAEAIQPDRAQAPASQESPILSRLATTWGADMCFVSKGRLRKATFEAVSLDAVEAFVLRSFSKRPIQDMLQFWALFLTGQMDYAPEAFRDIPLESLVRPAAPKPSAAPRAPQAEEAAPAVIDTMPLNQNFTGTVPLSQLHRVIDGEDLQQEIIGFHSKRQPTFDAPGWIVIMNVPSDVERTGVRPTNIYLCHEPPQNGYGKHVAVPYVYDDATKRIALYPGLARGKNGRPAKIIAAMEKAWKLESVGELDYLQT